MRETESSFSWGRGGEEEKEWEEGEEAKKVEEGEQEVDQSSLSSWPWL